MKNYSVRAVTLFASVLFAFDLRAASPEIEKAREFGALGQVTLCVADSTGKAVEEAHVRGGFFNPRRPGQVVTGATDDKGCFVATGYPTDDLNYRVTKDDYYDTIGQHWFYPSDVARVQGGRWEPWNPVLKVTLKERRNPVSMYAKEVDASLPVHGDMVGFDLEKGDWVAPHGQGTQKDLLFKYVAVYEDPQVFSKRLEITFTNALDGILMFPLEKTSAFKSIYDAPIEGYRSALVLETERTRTKIFKDKGLGEDEYLVFRVRTVTDKDGKIISTRHGKIYGPIDYGRMGDRHRLMFTYYFNPTSNDRNLEFDPKHNLIKKGRWPVNVP